ncbi:putative peptidoglycan binding domain protein [Mycobacterium kansasii]|uniref:Putative peptidoglycan binding domain protein n=1 Tax=Mycobacterium kansasii TaxID=1768 RepID=A0A1V3X8F8_MYCKA|nr:putative peptidoglycan binding domain protein [Mycobacterium kansasii]
MPSPRREDGDALRCGDRSAAVTEIRAALAALGMLDNPDEDLITGRHIALEVFDAELDQAVRAFQQHRGLLVDGIVGEATYRALKEASYRLGARTLYHQFGAPYTATMWRHYRPDFKISGSTRGWSTDISGYRRTMR